MFKIKIAEKIFEIDNKYSYLQAMCADYLCTGAPDEYISVTDAEIAAENKENADFGCDYLESLAVYRKICERLVPYDAVLFHCSAIAVDGEGLLFTAKSGTGKSTHARMWREVFGKRVVMINDDKPILRCVNGVMRVYGTPWCGKENLQTNTSVPIRAVVLLQRAERDSIEKISRYDALPRLLSQLYRPKDRTLLAQTLKTADRLLALPLYSLECTPTHQAARAAASKLLKANL